MLIYPCSVSDHCNVANQQVHSSIHKSSKAILIHNTMKLATAFATLAVCLTAGIHAQTTNTTDAASTNATDSAANTTSALVTGLEAVGNFKILASLIKMYPDEVSDSIAQHRQHGKSSAAPLLRGDEERLTITSLYHTSQVAEWTSSGNNLTLLAPVDSALTKANKTLSAMSKEDVLALLQYHTLAGTFEASSLSAINHTIAPSLLVNETYARLDGAPQGVVLSKDSKGTGIVLENGKNISFAGKGISSGPLSLVPISDVLTIPGNLTTALKAAGFTSFAQVLAATNSSMMLDMAESLTILVPTNAALAKAGDKLKTLNATQLNTALAGHIFNGTVIYSSNFAET